MRHPRNSCRPVVGDTTGSAIRMLASEHASPVVGLTRSCFSWKVWRISTRHRVCRRRPRVTMGATRRRGPIPPESPHNRYSIAPRRRSAVLYPIPSGDLPYPGSSNRPATNIGALSAPSQSRKRTMRAMAATWAWMEQDRPLTRGCQGINDATGPRSPPRSPAPCQRCRQTIQFPLATTLSPISYRQPACLSSLPRGPKI